MPRTLQSASGCAESLTHDEIAALVHDLRTPLGGIDAMIKMLALTPLSGDQTRILSGLEAASAHLRGLANKLLGREHFASTPPPCEFDAHHVQPFFGAEGFFQNINEFLESLLIATQARAKAKGIFFHLKHHPSDFQKCSVQVEPLRRVLENLIDNAIRMTNQGEVSLDVNLDVVRARITFQLRDTGPGLSEEHMSRFISADVGGDEKPSASGLGLRLAAALVAGQGGTLIGGKRQDNKKGAEFRFDWPYRQTKGLEASLPCLVVDDHASGRLILKTILSAMGVLCDEAEDGEAAWRKLTQHAYRAVFTDMQMPNGGGEALLNRIAQMPLEQQPLVVVVSAAQDLPSGIQKDILADMIQKPISVAALSAVVDKFDLAGC